MKKLLSFCLIFILCVSMVGCVKPKGEFVNSVALFVGSHIAYFNGEQGYIDADNYFVRPFMDENERVLVPLRYFVEVLGGNVVWNNQTGVADITFSGDETDCEKVVVTAGDYAMLVDGKERQLDTAAVIDSGRMFVPLRAIAEVVGKEVFFDSGLILINEHELIYESERDRDLLDALIYDYFTKNKITELPGAMEPSDYAVEPATLYEHVDYQAVYQTFCQKHLLPVVGQRSAQVQSVDTKSMNWSGYQAEPGLVCAFSEDMDDDGIMELVTVQEVADEDIFGLENTQNTSLQVHIYRVVEQQIACLDSVTVRQLLPLYAFVDVTLSDKTLMVSGIGAWAGDPGYNSHYRICFSDNKLSVETLSSMDIFTASTYETMEEEEKGNYDAALLKLKESGLGYKEMDDTMGACDLSAKRLALYSLFGKEGRHVGYFQNTFEVQKGFFDYTEAGAIIGQQK